MMLLSRSFAGTATAPLRATVLRRAASAAAATSPLAGRGDHQSHTDDDASHPVVDVGGLLLGAPAERRAAALAQVTHTMKMRPKTTVAILISLI